MSSDRKYGNVRKVSSTTSLASLSVLPDNIPVLIDGDDPVIDASGCPSDSAGMPVPERSVIPFPTLSASFDPIIEFGPGLQRVELPEPKLQTIFFVSGFTSITRLLNWSVISTFPF